MSFTSVSLDEQTCKILDEPLLLDPTRMSLCLMNRVLSYVYRPGDRE